MNTSMCDIFELLFRLLVIITQLYFIINSILCVFRSGVRIRSLGSGHTPLNLVISDLSSVRQKLKDNASACQRGKTKIDMSTKCLYNMFKYEGWTYIFRLSLM